MAGVRLSNESALGVFRFTWAYCGKRAGVLWYDGGGAPLTELGAAVQEVANPERFGWVTPAGSGKARLKAVRDFAQRFADALAEGDGS